VGISSVTWLNEGTGGRGVASGTNAWAAAVPLAPGNNVIRITAWDPSGNSSTVLLFVTFRPSQWDTLPPILSITSPTGGAGYSTAEARAQLAGTAVDNVEVSAVVWANATTGESGSASGLALWDSAIPLASGTNLIFVRAFDTSGNSSSSQMTVTFSIPPPPPNRIAAGHCGSVGVDLLWPLGLLWLARRAAGRRRKSSR
jgi:hypothetical protein